MPIDPTRSVSEDLTSADLDAAASQSDPTHFAPRDALPRLLTLGQTFHGLKIHSILGEGGMGAAYLASHPILRTPLVVKTFKTGGCEDEIFREARLAARASSPHVAGSVDAGVVDGIAFVVQRYVDGIDLQELIDHVTAWERRLPTDVICRVVHDAATGLHAIHQTGVVHRDIKSANLFLAGNAVATLGDFGIAVDVSAETALAAAGTVAVPGATVPHLTGTPQFMAPEQWAELPVDRRTDVYSLGATAHLLATGRPPFEGRNAVQLFWAHRDQPYTPPATTDPYEAQLFAHITRMLAKRPEDRFATADAVARAFVPLLRELPPVVVTSELSARFGELTLTLEQGDLSRVGGVDVIVSAANSKLEMRLGVANALRLAGGDELESEAQAHAPAAMGDVVWTGAGRLGAHWCAHAVAAIDGAICLQRATLRTLLGAEARRAVTVAMPALGTGVGEVPMDLGAKLVLEAVRTFAWLQPVCTRTIRVVLFRGEDLRRWQQVLRAM